MADDDPVRDAGREAMRRGLTLAIERMLGGTIQELDVLGRRILTNPTRLADEDVKRMTALAEGLIPHASDESSLARLQALHSAGRGGIAGRAATERFLAAVRAVFEPQGPLN